MMDDKPYQDYVKQAQHYLAIGNDKIYLFNDSAEPPWDIATHCEPGGSHRLDISTSVRFSGKHPCGLTFSWTFDIEPRSANGSGRYHVDAESIQRVLAKIKEPARQQFCDYLIDCAATIEKRADEYQKEASAQYGQASALRAATRV